MALQVWGLGGGWCPVHRRSCSLRHAPSRRSPVLAEVVPAFARQRHRRIAIAPPIRRRAARTVMSSRDNASGRCDGACRDEIKRLWPAPRTAEPHSGGATTRVGRGWVYWIEIENAHVGAVWLNSGYRQDTLPPNGARIGHAVAGDDLGKATTMTLSPSSPTSRPRSTDRRDRAGRTAFLGC